MLVLGRHLSSATKDVNKNDTNINEAQTSRAPPGFRYKEAMMTCGGSSIFRAQHAPPVSRSRSSISQLRRHPGRAAGTRAAGARSSHGTLASAGHGSRHERRLKKGDHPSGGRRNTPRPLQPLRRPERHPFFFLPPKSG